MYVKKCIIKSGNTKSGSLNSLIRNVYLWLLKRTTILIYLHIQISWCHIFYPVRIHTGNFRLDWCTCPWHRCSGSPGTRSRPRSFLYARSWRNPAHIRVWLDISDRAHPKQHQQSHNTILACTSRRSTARDTCSLRFAWNKARYDSLK